VEVLKNDDEKWAWLAKHVNGMVAKGQLLIFVKSIQSAEELTQNFTEFLGKKTEFLHGDLDQGERMRIIRDLRKQKVDVVIATDVAARGLDITTIYTVVCYDVARDIETHTHRIGRTGRAGAKGEAFTLLTNDDQNKKMAALLVENLEIANQTVPDDLQVLAMKYGPFRAARLQGAKFDGAKKKKGVGPAVQSSFGVGFDGQQLKKETTQDLGKRLDKEADMLAAMNRQIMTGGGSRSAMAAARAGLGAKGFVKAATADEPSAPPKAPKDDESSDEDLFAPGVTAAFGKAQRPAPAGPGGWNAGGMQQQMAAQMQAQSMAQQMQQLQQVQQIQAASLPVLAAEVMTDESLNRPPPPGSSGGFSNSAGAERSQRRLRSRSRSKSRGRRRRRSPS